jgi:acyl dehydratase
VPRLYWEDFSPGSVSDYGPRRISREEMVAFAAEYDPQSFHLDEDAARLSLLGGLSASGWHSCCLMMRILTDGFIGDSTFMGAPGIEEVRWLKPLRPGESITIRSTVLETRASQSRPRMGFVKFLFEMLNASGEPIMTLTVTPMFGRRADDM